MWSLFGHYLFLISPSVCASGGLCLVFVAFPWYIHYIFYIFISFLIIASILVTLKIEYTLSRCLWAYAASQTTNWYMKKPNKTESPSFVLLYDFCFQRQPFRFESFKDRDKYGKMNLKGKYGYVVSFCLAIRRTQPLLNEAQREKTYFQTCTANEDSNQPAHSHHLINLRCPHEETLHPWQSKNAPSEDFGQNAKCAGWSEPSLGTRVQNVVKCVLEAYEEVRLGHSQFARRSTGHSRLYNLYHPLGKFSGRPEIRLWLLMCMNLQILFSEKKGKEEKNISKCRLLYVSLHVKH